MEQKEKVGLNISLLRHKLGLTQNDLASYLGITREEVSYFENGHRNIPTDLISKTSQLFGVEEYDLYEDDLEAQETNLAFAFRAVSLETNDLVQIASFKKIIQNYLRMSKALMDE